MRKNLKEKHFLGTQMPLGFQISTPKVSSFPKFHPHNINNVFFLLFFLHFLGVFNMNIIYSGKNTINIFEAFFKTEFCILDSMMTTILPTH